MDLYDLPVAGAAFTACCGGNLQSEHETCLEIAHIPGSAEGFVIRDTKPEGAGRELRVSGAELDAFVLGVAGDRGLNL